MKNYDTMASGMDCPYAMLSGPISYSDPVISTDKHGFRLTECNDNIYKVENIEEYDEINILIGGSTVFGVGASSNLTTIPSYLAKKTGQVWLNFGLRGGVSLQEYIHLIRFIHKSKKINNIVFLSGNNDLYINLVSELNSHFDRRFGETESLEFSYSCKRKFFIALISKITGIERRHLLDKSLKNLMRMLVSKPVIKDEILTFTEKLDQLFDNYDRNFLLYSALQKQLNCEISFVLQPFFTWTGKTASETEGMVFAELEEIQKGSTWNFYKDKMDVKLYERYKGKLNELSNRYNLGFYDTNIEFNSEQTLFVDAVHLTDLGNQRVSEVIIKRVLK